LLHRNSEGRVLGIPFRFQQLGTSPYNKTGETVALLSVPCSLVRAPVRYLLKALRPFRYLELHRLTLLQATKTVAPDRREMHENIFASLTAEKAEALGIVEPFPYSLFHCLLPISVLNFC
jgi:hypothetical protein